MRLNFSHATYEEADLRMKNLKLSPGKNNVPNNLNLRAVMLDTQGPEIRTGSFAGDVKEITWETGRKVGSNSVTCRLCYTCPITVHSNKTMDQSWNTEVTKCLCITLGCDCNQWRFEERSNTRQDMDILQETVRHCNRGGSNPSRWRGYWGKTDIFLLSLIS